MLKTLQYDGLRWFFKQAAVMAENRRSGLVVEDGFVDLMIPVSRLQNIDIGIKEALAPLINHQCDSLRGILIAYSRLRVLSPHIDLSDDASEMEKVRVHGTFVIFRPEPGQLLEGVITRVNPRHIACLVLKNFAASIQSESGSNVNLTSVYSTGQNIRFKFAKLENHNGISSLRGLLSDEDILAHRQQKSDSDLNPNDVDSWNADLASGSDGVILRATPKKFKKPFVADVTPDSGVYPDTVGESSVEPVREKMKHKKRKELNEPEVPVDASSPSEPVPEVVTEDLSKKEKKKRKRESDLLKEGTSTVVSEHPPEVNDVEVEQPPRKKRKKDKKETPKETADEPVIPESVPDVAVETPEAERKHKKKKHRPE